MPDNPRPPPSVRARVLTALAGVGIGLAIFAVVLQVAGPRSSEQAGDAVFELSASLADNIAEDGPLLFQDLLGGTRDIYVQHLGDDDWRAFEARGPGAGPACVLEWRPEGRLFVDPCDGRTFPADGTGLRIFAATVEGKKVKIDLRSEAPPAR